MYLVQSDLSSASEAPEVSSELISEIYSSICRWNGRKKLKLSDRYRSLFTDDLDEPSMEGYRPCDPEEQVSQARAFNLGLATVTNSPRIAELNYEPILDSLGVRIFGAELGLRYGKQPLFSLNGTLVAGWSSLEWLFSRLYENPEATNGRLSMSFTVEPDPSLTEGKTPSLKGDFRRAPQGWYFDPSKSFNLPRKAALLSESSKALNRALGDQRARNGFALDFELIEPSPAVPRALFEKIFRRLSAQMDLTPYSSSTFEIFGRNLFPLEQNRKMGREDSKLFRFYRCEHCRRLLVFLSEDKSSKFSSMMKELNGELKSWHDLNCDHGYRITISTDGRISTDGPSL